MRFQERRIGYSCITMVSRRMMVVLSLTLTICQILVQPSVAWSSFHGTALRLLPPPSPPRSPHRTNAAKAATSAAAGSRTELTMMRAANPVLDDWKVLTNGRVVGKVKFHPSIPDGETITTSPVTKPELAGPRKIVTTISGSKYMLGTPKMLPVANGKQAVVSLQELQRRAKVEYALNGDVIGDDTRQYLLAGKATKSTSGKSQIFKCYRANPVDGLPVGDALTAKISTNWEAIEREAANYNRITKAGVTRGQFVTLLDFLPTASIITKKYSTSSALIMERGAIDLKRYIAVNGALSGKELRDAASAAAQCLQAVHDSGLVWTDMKTENFVVTEEGQVKGIDLESAMPVRDNPVDYSPEATPPEFAKAFLEGDGPYFVLQQKYDMWSFGMLLYELAGGKGYWDGKSPIQITRALREEPTIKLDNVDFDEKLKNLIQKLLQVDPKSRLGIVQVLLHPYFLTTGFGPFGF